jgi:hypothetical protein
MKRLKMVSNPFLRRIRYGRASLVAAALASLVLVAPADAALLNWTAAPGNTWAAGSLSNQFNVDGVPGNDIQVTVTTSATNTLNSALGTMSPFAGTSASVGAGASALEITSSGLGPSNKNSITVTITFLGTYATGAYANFTLYDVDENANDFTDQIKNITAQKAGGGTIGLNETVGSEVTLTNGGTVNATATGTSSISDHTGDVSISSGTTKVTSITFTWSDPGANDGGQQAIGLSDISFSSTPEVGSGIAALVFCGLLVGGSRWRGLVRA